MREILMLSWGCTTLVGQLGIRGIDETNKRVVMGVGRGDLVVYGQVEVDSCIFLHTWVHALLVVQYVAGFYHSTANGTEAHAMSCRHIGKCSLSVGIH